MGQKLSVSQCSHWVTFRLLACLFGRVVFVFLKRKKSKMYCRWQKGMKQRVLHPPQHFVQVGGRLWETEKAVEGAPWWLRELGIWCCPCCDSGCCGGAGSIPGPRTSTWHGHDQKKAVDGGAHPTLYNIEESEIDTVEATCPAWLSVFESLYFSLLPRLRCFYMFMGHLYFFIHNLFVHIYCPVAHCEFIEAIYYILRIITKQVT